MEKRKTPLALWLEEQPRGALSRLAERTGMSPGHIHNIKCGSSITVDTAKRISKETGIQPAVLLGLDGV
jgi:plasmid maintenance system antidote protein VapI